MGGEEVGLALDEGFEVSDCEVVGEIEGEDLLVQWLVRGVD